MGKYSTEPLDASKACKARGSNLRVHFKNTQETARAIKGLSLKRAQRFLEDVIAHKDIVPFRRHTGGIGHKAQCKKHNTVSGRWPEKSCRYLLDLLQNAGSNAEIQGIEVETLFISHIQVQQAPAMRRRTYRAHGRINPYMSCPAHVELILSAKAEPVKKAAAEDGSAQKRVKGKRQKRLGNASSGFE
jgi:large subunit ribosomal protein L17e